MNFSQKMKEICTFFLKKVYEPCCRRIICLVFSFLIAISLCDRFGLSSKTRRDPNVEKLEEWLPSMYEVYVCLYENRANGWYIRIGCCEDDRQRVMDNEMDIAMFTVVGFFKTKLRDRTKFKNELSGGYKFAHCRNMLPVM